MAGRPLNDSGAKTVPQKVRPARRNMAGKRTDLPYRDLEHPFFTEAYQVEAGT